MINLSIRSLLKQLDSQPPTPIPLLEQELAPLLACFSVRLRSDPGLSLHICLLHPALPNISHSFSPRLHPFRITLLWMCLLSCDEDGLGYRTTSSYSYVLSKNPRIFPKGVSLLPGFGERNLESVIAHWSSSMARTVDQWATTTRMGQSSQSGLSKDDLAPIF